MNALGGTPIYLLSLIVQICSFILLLRVLLQLVQADFFNPVSQTIFKLSAPVIEPLNKVFPTIGTLNLAALMAAILIRWAFYLVMGLVTGVNLVDILLYIPIAAFDLLYALIEIYFWGIFILAISSWVGTTGHPSVQTGRSDYRTLSAPLSTANSADRNDGHLSNDRNNKFDSDPQ